MSVVIDITKEQRIKLQKEMGIICDQLVLSELPEDEELRVSDLGENVIVAMNKTYPVS